VSPELAAKLSAAVYEEWPSAEATVTVRLGLEFVRSWDHGGTQAMLVRSADWAAVVFRGTEASRVRLLDIWSNLGWPLPWAGPGLAHSGYASHFLRIRPSDLHASAAALDLPVYAAGHSMGGALAALFAAYNPGLLAGAALFGAPKCLDRVAGASITCSVQSYYNRHDFARWWPPAPSLRPVGQVIAIDSGGWPGPVSRHGVGRYVEALESLPKPA